MRRTPLCRALALFMCAQPFLWTGQAAQAQVFQQPGSAAVPALPLPVAPGEPEVVTPERPALSSRLPSPTPIDERLDPDKYVCGAGDLLELNFWGLQNFRIRVAVDLEGRAFVPKVGYFALQGKTLTKARRTMRESVARYFPRLSFDVALAE